jgi:predicted small lipoprotein YifL
MKRWIRAFLLVSTIAALVGCGQRTPKTSPTAAKSTATATATAVDQAIGAFHQRLDAGDFEAIWKGADDGFRSGVPRTQFDQYLANIHQKLGRVIGSTQLQSAPTGTAARPTLLALQNTRFEHGGGIETFTFAMGPKGAVLIGYNLQSQALSAH